jgi:hypothetical protein
MAVASTSDDGWITDSPWVLAAAAADDGFAMTVPPV